MAFSPTGELFATNFQNVGGGVQRFSAQGVSLGVFSPGIASPFGIGLIPATAVTVPESSALLLVLPAVCCFATARLGMVGAVIIKRRKK